MATPADAPELSVLHNAVAARLTAEYGIGHWSRGASDAGVLRAIRDSSVLLARRGSIIVGTLRLATKKPWAIDVAYFTPAPRPLYLLDMAVLPPLQGRGVGRRMLEEAETLAAHRESGAIRLDAYDAPAGAGTFYARCGYREVGRVVYRSVPLVYFERLP